MPTKEVGATSWFHDCMASVERNGWLGLWHTRLPRDDEDRTALLYQFFILIEKRGLLTYRTFALLPYEQRGRSFQDMVDVVNGELVLEKFTREVSYPP